MLSLFWVALILDFPLVSKVIIILSFSSSTTFGEVKEAIDLSLIKPSSSFTSSTVNFLARVVLKYGALFSKAVITILKSYVALSPLLVSPYRLNLKSPET